MRANKSAIVITDPEELTDRRLDPKEALCKLTEENRSMVAHLRQPDQDLLNNQDMGLGQQMEWEQLVYLLHKMCPALIIKDGGVRNAIQLRYPSDDPMYATVNKGDGTKYVGGFFKRALPEYGWQIDDERGIPTTDVRGWRTVVKGLIEQRIISYTTAVDIFGEPNGQRSGRWKKLLRRYKPN